MPSIEGKLLKYVVLWRFGFGKIVPPNFLSLKPLCASFWPSKKEFWFPKADKFYSAIEPAILIPLPSITKGWID